MEVDAAPLDDKAKRMRDLLSSFYSPDPSSLPSSSSSTSAKYVTHLDAINSASFDPDQYMNLLVQKSNLEGLLQRHVEMAAEIKNLDTDLQMLVYENYNKFVSATDTIKRMKSNIVVMESNIEELLEKIVSVQSRSDGVNTSLFGKREHIEKLHRTRNLLRKVQFIYDLPATLTKCIKSEAYADAVRFYTGAMPIFRAYGDTSFQDCKRASDEAMVIITKNLQGKLFSDSESIQARAEAAVLLKQLDFPVDNLKAKLLEKLEQSVVDLQLKTVDINNICQNPGDKEGNDPQSLTSTSHKGSVGEFAEAVRAYQLIFPDSGKQLVAIAHGLITKHFEAIEQCVENRIPSADLLCALRIVWEDVLLLAEILDDADLPRYAQEVAQLAVKEYAASTFSRLLQDITDVFVQVHGRHKEDQENNFLQYALEAGKHAVSQGSIDLLMEFRQLLDSNLELIMKLRNLIIHWVQEGFQKFFSDLDNQFLLLSGRKHLGSQDQELTLGILGDRVSAGIVLVLAQLSALIEQTVVPRVTEEIAASFSGGGVRGYEYGPAFIPGEICRLYRSAGEKFLNLYISMRTQRISVLLSKRFRTPNWVKHKEPREVHMFVDLFLQELETIGKETKQILPQGLNRHRRTDSNGSTNSSRSNPLREEKLSRSNTQRARSQLLETHLAKLFKQKVEIFTKVEYTQESIVSTIVKLCLKSLQEFARLQTFNRTGFQQVQLDTQFLRIPLKEIVEDEAAIDFLLDEVIVAALERCLDPIPLEPPILDKLIQAKLAKFKQPNPLS